MHVRIGRFLSTFGLLLLVTGAAQTPRYAVVVGTGSPIVSTEVNNRVTTSAHELRVLVEPGAPANTPVRWTSPDGKNEFGPSGITIARPVGSYSSTLGLAIAIHSHGFSRGPAIVVADIGAPVNLRATYYARNVIGIGFGCNYFFPQSVRFVDGIPESSSLSDADIAIVGPGKIHDACSGENFDPTATSYRLVFRNGGRVGNGQFAYAFFQEMPYDAVINGLDVLGADGRIFRLHVSPAGRNSFTGWIEEIDTFGRTLDE